MKNTEQDRYGVLEKCRAVLAIWTERKKASVLCREMGVGSSLLWQWQDRALSGMLEALEPRGREGRDGPALAQQIKRLLDRKIRVRELEMVGRLPRKPRTQSLPRSERGSPVAGPVIS